MRNVSQGLIAGRSYVANDCLLKRFDEMTTKTTDGDTVQALSRQMEKMSKQMKAMMTTNKEVMRERGGGLGAFGATNVDTASGRVGLLVPPVLPAANTFDPPLAQRHDGDLGPGSGNPHSRKLPRISRGCDGGRDADA